MFAENRDELLQLGDAILHARVGGKEALARLRGRDHVIVVIARIHAERAVVEVAHVRADAVQKVAVVRDDDHRRVAGIQHVLEPADRVDVEVIGRLVEEQDVRVGEQRLCEQHAELPPRCDVAHRTLMERRGDAKPQQQLAGARLGGVAAELREMRFEVGGAKVVFLRRIGVGIDRVALRLRGPQLLVAHEDDIEHPLILVGKLVLLQLAEPLVGIGGDVAAGGFEVVAEHFHQRRFPAAVGADEAIAVAVAELDGDVFEQGPRPELHREIGGREHVT